MFLILLVILGAAEAFNNDNFKGCYRSLPSSKDIQKGYSDINECNDMCKRDFYRYVLDYYEFKIINSHGFVRYAIIKNENECFCTNFLGSEFNSQVCKESCISCPEKSELADVYETGNVG